MRSGGQTEARPKKLTVTFRDFVNASESGKMSLITGYHGTSRESVFFDVMPFSLVTKKKMTDLTEKRDGFIFRV